MYTVNLRNRICSRAFLGLALLFSVTSLPPSSVASLPPLILDSLSWRDLPIGCSLYFYQKSLNSPLLWTYYSPSTKGNTLLLLNVNGVPTQADIFSYSNLQLKARFDDYSLVLSTPQWVRIGYELQKSEGRLSIFDKTGKMILSLAGSVERGC